MTTPPVEISVGLCHCGCGGRAPIAKKAMPRRGYVKGQPQRFIYGHAVRRAVTKSYRGVHRAGESKRLHVMRAERALGKSLPMKAVVHHADGSKGDDAPLVICQNQAYHFLLHARMRIKAAGGDPNVDAICGRCHLVKPRAAFSPDRTNIALEIYRYCRPCAATARRLQYARQHARRSKPEPTP